MIAPEYIKRVARILFVAVVTNSYPSGLLAVEITVDTDLNHQRIEGFGASIIGWGSTMPPLYSEPAFIDYVVDELGLSMFRMQVWPRVSETPVANWEDIRHEDFVWTGAGQRGKINLDFAVELKRRNPDIRIIGSIWSPPAWMKENGSINGTRAGFLLDSARDWDLDNRLDDDYLQHYVKFMVEYQKHLVAHGVGLYAFGVQNEPMFTQTFESSLVSGAEYAELVKALGQQYEAEGMRKPLFFGPEDMTLASYNPQGTTADQTRHNPYVENLMREDVAPYFDVWATHGYVDGVSAGSRMDPAAYWDRIEQFGRPYWITEGGTGGHDWPVPVTEGSAAYIHYALVGGNVSAFVCWQITDSSANTHGIMHMRNPTKKTYATMHYWRFIRPRAVRVAAEPSDSSGIRISAYRDAALRQLIVVAINSGSSERALDVTLEGSFVANEFEGYRTSASQNLAELDAIAVVAGALSDTLPGYSITTYVANEAGWSQHPVIGPLKEGSAGWQWHPDFKEIHAGHFPWIYSRELGWLYISGENYSKGIHYLMPDAGWRYTGKMNSPWYYDYAGESWGFDE